MLNESLIDFNIIQDSAFFANNVFLPIFYNYALRFFTAFPSFAVEGGTLRWITLYVSQKCLQILRKNILNPANT